MTKEELMQKELEIESSYRQDGYEAMMKAINDAKSKGEVTDNTFVGKNIFKHKVYQLNEAIKQWLEESLKPKGGVKSAHLFLLEDLKKEFKDNNGDFEFDKVAGMMTTITLSSIINTLCAYGDEAHPLNNLGYTVGSGIEHEYRLRAFANWLKRPEQAEYRNSLVGIDKRVGEDYRSEYMAKAMKLCNYEPHRWYKGNQAGMRALGVCLVNIAEQVTHYFEIKASPKVLTYIQATPFFNEMWEKNEDNILYLAHKLCPMVYTPKPWTDYNNGGYYGALAEFNHFLRLKQVDSAFGQTYKDNISVLDMPEVYRAINSNQETPWEINKEVLEVMKYCRSLGYIPNGKESEGVIRLDGDDFPTKPGKEATQEQIDAYKKKASDWFRNEKRRASLQNRANSIINTADRFKDYEAIYFPYNMDFRGRIYPIPLFSPQGDDLSKGLLLFHDVPPFNNEEDIKFMAITGANLAGVDKVSYDDRIKWVYENESYILGSAEDPMGCMWWLHQDEPVEMLAWCFEWKKMKDWMSSHNGSIIGFKTGFPYAQDGTCSGLQHFSAILRDTVGGNAVNLVPQDKPNDIYAQVAEKVNVLLLDDAVHGEPDYWKKDRMHLGSKTCAQLWLSFAEKKGWGRKITRKVTKRPTMTLAYGATEYGFRKMLLEDTIDPAIEREMKDCCPFTKTNATDCAIYMASLIWKSVGTVVTKAVEGMEWLHDCAEIVVNNSNVVSWSTPMGLLLQQNYCEYDVKLIKLRCAGKRYKIYAPEQTGKVNRSKQIQGIAPNFIHSMDACHLQMTICEAVDQGIHHFAMIHDSYGCPMSQAYIMYDVVRKCFVKLYTENDVLQNFKEDMQKLLPKNVDLPDIPSKGDLDLDIVLDSKYIFC